MNFPQSWPDGCPPKNATSPDGVFLYRTVKNNPPTNDDFKSQAELGKMPNAEACQREGISMMRNKQDAVHHQQLFGKRVGKIIAYAVFNVSHGLIKNTPTGVFPSHVTWWPPLGVAREKLFSVCDEGMIT